MAQKKLRFRVKIEGKEAGVVSAITPPIDVPETFQTRGRVPVTGTINGYPFRSSLMPMRGCHMMPVNKALCEGAGVRPGEIGDVVMERDVEERIVKAPPELEKELKKSKKARERWDSLAFTHKKEMASSIRGAKQEETRKRRLAKGDAGFGNWGKVDGIAGLPRRERIGVKIPTLSSQKARRQG